MSLAVLLLLSVGVVQPISTAVDIPKGIWMSSGIPFREPWANGMPGPDFETPIFDDMVSTAPTVPVSELVQPRVIYMTPPSPHGRLRWLWPSFVYGGYLTIIIIVIYVMRKPVALAQPQQSVGPSPPCVATPRRLVHPRQHANGDTANEPSRFDY